MLHQIFPKFCPGPLRRLLRNARSGGLMDDSLRPAAMIGDEGLD
jgi:hypothetical protein